MKAPATTQPRCIVIAGANGAGKTTFARDFLLRDVGVNHFVNADLIAGGLAPLHPPSAELRAARLFLAEIDRLAHARVNFSFETTLSGRAHLARLQRLKSAGYRIELIFLRLDSPALALRRVALRVQLGGHDVPRAEVLRRFDRGLQNFPTYRLLADSWAVYDNSSSTPILIERTA